jgi:hypothetical protein
MPRAETTGRRLTEAIATDHRRHLFLDPHLVGRHAGDLPRQLVLPPEPGLGGVNANFVILHLALP